MGIEYINFGNQKIFTKTYIDPKENLMSVAAAQEDLNNFTSDLNLIYRQLI